MRPRALPYALLATLAVSFETQEWTYNASLWWSQLVLVHDLRGPLLAALAEELTQLTYGTFEVAKAACLGQSGICPEAGQCDRQQLRWALQELQDVYMHNARQLALQLREQPGPAAGPVPPTAAALAAVEPASMEGCGELGEVLSTADEPCLPLVQAALFCARGASARAREGMAELHAAQIQEIGMLEAEVQGQPIPWPPPARFEGGRGLDRAEVLASLLLQMGDRPLRAVEVGVDDGRTSEALLAKVPRLRLLLVDPYEFAGEDFFARERTRSTERAVQAMDTVWARLAPYRDRSVLVCQGSLEAAEWVADGSLDLVFVDGDHAYEAVRKDMRAWRPKLRPGGILAGHDYSLFRPGVARALHEFAAELGQPMTLGSDHVWWLRF